MTRLLSEISASTSRLAAGLPIAKLAAAAIFLMLISGSAGFAQDAAPPENEQPAVATPNNIDTAPVVIDGETYFVLRGARSITAAERAEDVQAKIIEAAEKHPDRSPNVQTDEAEFGIAITVDGVEIIQVTETDAAFEGFPLDIVTALFASRIDEAVENHRAGRTEAGTYEALRDTLVWTAVFSAFLWGVFRLRKWSRLRVERKVRQWLEGIEQQTGRVVDSSSLLQAHRMATRGILILIIAFAAYYYVAAVLSEFAFTKGFARLLLDILAAPLIDLGRAALGEVPDLITVLIIVLMTRFLLKLLRLVFVNIENGAIQIKGFDPQWIWPTHRIIRFVIVIAAIVVAYPYIPGSDSAAFRGMTVLLGLVVSLGANSVAANLFAGLIVVYKRSVSVGDRIKVAEIRGTVEHVSLLDTHVRSLKNELVSVPNTKMLSSEVVNYTQTAGPQGLIIHTTVGIGYDEAPDIVDELLIAAARETDGVKAKPGPFVLSQGLNAHDVSYEINAYCKKDSDPVRVASALRRNILRRFNAAGVQIMTPFYTGDPEELKIPRRAAGSEGESGAENAKA